MKGFDEAALSRGQEYACYPCKDWGTVVIEDDRGNPVEVQPCPDCAPVKYQAWLSEKTTQQAESNPNVGDLVVVKSICQLCTVELWATFETPGGEPVVFVRSVADGAAWWVELSDVQKVSREAAGL